MEEVKNERMEVRVKWKDGMALLGFRTLLRACSRPSERAYNGNKMATENSNGAERERNGSGTLAALERLARSFSGVFKRRSSRCALLLAVPSCFTATHGEIHTRNTPCEKDSYG